MTVRILRGDCRDLLRTLADESVHCVVTSPPYWGLRDYGIPASIWGGTANCDHEWGAERMRGGPGGGQGSTSQREGRANSDIQGRRGDSLGAFCQICGAWRGALGLEPDPYLFVENMVEVFREVWRVLRMDGTLWLNLGDSYAAGGNGGHQRSGPAGELSTLDGRRDRKTPSFHGHTDRGLADHTGQRRNAPAGLKSKDLVGAPWRVAFALQADGWYLRQDIVWAKPNPMPESVTDRCTKAHEYLFLLAKSDRYYYDQDAILEPVSESTHARLSQDVMNQVGSDRAVGKTNGKMKAVGRRGDRTPGGWATGTDRSEHNNLLGNYTQQRKDEAARRPKAWDNDMGSNRTLVAGHGRKLAEANSGTKNNESFDDAMSLLVSERNKRSVWTVTTQPFKEAHFATFPPKLIEPCILAGSSAHGCCSKCGGGWFRVLGKPEPAAGRSSMNKARKPGSERDCPEGTGSNVCSHVPYEPMATPTIGWYPSCSCDGLAPWPEYPRKPKPEKIAEWLAVCRVIDVDRLRFLKLAETVKVVPAVILDPFGGAGTTGLVADRSGRDAILCELNPAYADMADRRIVGDSPLFAQVTA